MRLNHAVNQGRDQLLKSRVYTRRDLTLHHAINLADVPLVQSEENCPLVWEVLVNGPDTDHEKLFAIRDAPDLGEGRQSGTSRKRTTSFRKCREMGDTVTG